MVACSASMVIENDGSQVPFVGETVEERPGIRPAVEDHDSGCAGVGRFAETAFVRTESLLVAMRNGDRDGLTGTQGRDRFGEDCLGCSTVDVVIAKNGDWSARCEPGEYRGGGNRFVGGSEVSEGFAQALATPRVGIGCPARCECPGDCEWRSVQCL